MKTNYGKNEQMVREAIEKAAPGNAGFALKAFELALESEKVNSIIEEAKERCDREGSTEFLNNYVTHALKTDCISFTKINTGNKDLDTKQRSFLKKFIAENLTVEV